MYIKSMLIVLALESREAMLPEPTNKSSVGTEPSSTLWAAIDKGKEIYVPFPKKTPSMNPKGVNIGAPFAYMPLVEEVEAEPVLGGLDLTPLAASNPLEELSEERHLALAVKASFDTTQEERGPRVVCFIYD